MKIAILGAGAMGALVGAHLKKGGENICFVDPYELHMEAVAQHGLNMKLEGRPQERVPIDLATTKAEEAGICDAVILLVKGMNTRKTIEDSPGLFGKNTVVLTLQNGIGNVDILKEYFPEERIGYGVLKASATLQKPGSIAGRVKFAYSSKGVYFTSLCRDTPYRTVFERIEAALEKGGFPAELSDKTEALIWDKLFINILYNAPCALLQLAGEDFMRHGEGEKLLRELGREVCEVASAKGILMDADTYWEKERKNIAMVPDEEHHFTSTVLDVYRKQKTEIEFLNGAVCREGAKYKIPTPYNQTIYYLMRVREDTYNLVFTG